MFETTPAALSGRPGSADGAAIRETAGRASRFAAAAARSDVAAPIDGRRPTSWADLPTDGGRLSEVRRRLRAMQVERAVSGRGLAA